MHCIDIHLTVFAIELQTEAATIGQPQGEGLLIGGTLTTMLDAVAHGVLQTMAALHEGSLPLTPLGLPLTPPEGGGIELEGSG